MAKTTEKKSLTIAERKAELEQKILALDTLASIEEEITDLAKKYRDYYEEELCDSVEDGLEDKQATNYRDELLFKLKGESGHFTVSELAEKGYDIENENVTPYYRTKYKQVKSDMSTWSDWRKQRAIKYRKLAEFFESIDIMEAFGE